MHAVRETYVDRLEVYMHENIPIQYALHCCWYLDPKDIPILHVELVRLALISI